MVSNTAFASSTRTNGFFARDLAASKARAAMRPPATMADRPAPKRRPCRKPEAHRLPFDIRALYTTLRLIYRVALFYRKVRLFVIAHVGGPTTRPIGEARLATCSKCPVLRVVKGHQYCGSCGCGLHRLARLPYKTRLAWALCPLKRFAGAPAYFGLFQSLRRKTNVK